MNAKAAEMMADYGMTADEMAATFGEDWDRLDDPFQCYVCGTTERRTEPDGQNRSICSDCFWKQA